MHAHGNAFMGLCMHLNDDVGLRRRCSMLLFFQLTISQCQLKQFRFFIFLAYLFPVSLEAASNFYFVSNLFCCSSLAQALQFEASASKHWAHPTNQAAFHFTELFVVGEGSNFKEDGVRFASGRLTVLIRGVATGSYHPWVLVTFLILLLGMVS